MPVLRVVIVGGVAGGATAAARLRRLQSAAKITVFERGADVSFANCGLPYYLGHEIKERSKLVINTPQSLSAALAVDVKANHEVLSINAVNKTVKVCSKETGVVFDEPYDKLLLSMGASPFFPPIPGCGSSSSSSSSSGASPNAATTSTSTSTTTTTTTTTNQRLPNVFALRDLKDTDAIAKRLDELSAIRKQSSSSSLLPPPVHHAVILGAGFVGLEMVEAFARRGLAVTLVEAQAHALPAMDTDMITALTNDMRHAGVSVLTNDRATAITENTSTSSSSSSSSSSSLPAEATSSSSSLQIHLSSGTVLPADIVLVSTGVRPETSLAVAAGLEIDKDTRAIAVNAHLQTSNPDIYAVGDAVAAPSFANPQKRSWLPMGGPANRQGRLAAEHMVFGDSGGADTYRGNLGTAIVRVFNTVVGVTGATSGSLTLMGIPHENVIVTGYSHASYYPGAQPITLKVTFDPQTRKLYGAQAYGGTEGVDKRLDVLATALSMGATVDDLAHLELSYAPPFGAARDVVNTAGFAAQNIAKGLLSPEYNLQSIPADRVLLDVRDRTSSSLHPIHAPHQGSQVVLNIPHEELRTQMRVLQKEGVSYTTICNLGKLSYFGSRTLKEAGFTVSSLIGGLSNAESPIANQPATISSFAEEDQAAARGVSDGRKANTTTPLLTTSTTPTNSFSPSTTTTTTSAPAATNVDLDACGLACPGPILALRNCVTSGSVSAPGSTITVKASDPGFLNDVKAFASSANLEVLSLKRSQGIITAVLKTPGSSSATTTAAVTTSSSSSPLVNASTLTTTTTPATMGNVASSLASLAGATSSISSSSSSTSNPNDVAIVVFSGELDKVLAALVIANGATAMGGKATMFFTFWGLNALRRDHTFPDLEKKGDEAAAEAGHHPVYTQKQMQKEDEDNHQPGTHANILQKMMGLLLPSGPSHLPLSNMNFSGAGAMMMKQVMSSRHLPTVDSLMRQALEGGGVRFVACTMSMDALGIAPAKLLPGIELGGVADFLASASKAHTTLFI